MKILNLVRHAKSSWDNANLTDFDRPLNNRGKKNAKELSQVLANANSGLELIVCSAAERAYSTAQLITEHFTGKTPMVSEHEYLYHAGVTTWLDTIQAFDNQNDEVMIIGHEPTMSALTNTFLREPLQHVITSSCSRLHFDTNSWSEVDQLTLQKGIHYNRHHWDGIPLK